MWDGASDYLFCLVAIIIFFFSSLRRRGFAVAKKIIGDAFFFLIVNEGMESDIRLCTYGDHRYGMVRPYKKTRWQMKKQDYGMICVRNVWYGQSRKERQTIIDACNVDIWYGDAEGESLRKS